MTFFCRYVLLAGLLFVYSCTKDVGTKNYGAYPNNIDKIVKKNCSVSGCHNTASYMAAGALNLETWSELFKGSANGSPVIPYNSKYSSLCYYINTFVELGPQNGPTMPLNRTSLSYDDVKAMKDWIDKGAPDLNGTVKWADNPKRKKLYAVNQGCDVVTVFDSETRLPMRYIEVGNKLDTESPHQLKVSPDGNYWYVLFIGNNILQKFRCSDDSYVGDIPLTPFAAGTTTNTSGDAQNWNTLAISSDGKRAYCVSWTASGKVAAVDLENMKLLHYSGGFYEPHGITLNRTEDKIYVASQRGNFITEIDTGFQFGTKRLVIENGATENPSSSLDPHDMILSPDGQNILITCQQTNELRVFNIATASVIAVVSLGSFPQEIMYSKSTNQYFITCTNDVGNGFTGAVSRVDGTTFAHTKLNVGYQPHGLAVDENTKILYVLSRNVSSAGPPSHHTGLCGGKNGFVNFIDLNTFTLLPKKTELSVDPYYIYARP
ncbi:MAG: YncE family protein [Bacteroidia bacterium]|nr:YncE family protein [Bacteroidia bacterium]